MAKVFVIGAAGKIGRRLCQRLSARGHQPLGMYRKVEQEELLRGLGAAAVSGDLLELDESGLADRMAGCDCLVFTAGAGGAGIELTNAIDGRGVELSVAAAKLAGISRLILVSAFPEARRNQETTVGFENYVAVKKRADTHLAATDLNWVSVRPGRLTDDPGTGKVQAAAALDYGEIPRDDVAETLVQLIERPEINRIIIELTSGETPISAALDRMISS